MQEARQVAHSVNLTTTGGKSSAYVYLVDNVDDTERGNSAVQLLWFLALDQKLFHP
jgi:hypothetical protein